MKKGLIITIAILIFILSILLYARFLGTSGLQVKEYSIINKNIPTELHGFKILHFSDINFNTTDKKLKTLIKKSELIKPDIIVFSGNLILKDYKINNMDFTYLTGILNKLKSKYGNYYVLGENDNKEVIDIMEKANFINITDAFDVINNSIYIGNINTSETYNYKILLNHKPDEITEFKNFDLALSGHSLNRQINIPYINLIFKQKGSEQYYKEHYKINKTDLYISNGIGTSKFKFRLFNKPSINLFRIEKK